MTLALAPGTTIHVGTRLAASYHVEPVEPHTPTTPVTVTSYHEGEPYPWLLTWPCGTAVRVLTADLENHANIRPLQGALKLLVRTSEPMPTAIYEGIFAGIAPSAKRGDTIVTVNIEIARNLDGTLGEATATITTSPVG